MCSYRLYVGGRTGIKVGRNIPSAPMTNLACTISILLSSSIASKRSIVTCSDHYSPAKLRAVWLHWPSVDMPKGLTVRGRLAKSPFPQVVSGVDFHPMGSHRIDKNSFNGSLVQRNLDVHDSTQGGDN